MKTSQIFAILISIQFVICEECGGPPNFYNAASLVVSGVTSEKNKFPFLATLFNLQTTKYFCGGTLISHHHIISAAHCFQDKRTVKKLEANKIVAYLGKYDLRSQSDRYVYPNELIIHDDWNINDASYDADIAILYVQDMILFRINIYPACLWTNDDGKNAILVGYGTSEDQQVDDHQNVPHEALISFVSNEECSKNRELRQLISQRTLCGGGRGKANPCRGDSGTGVYIKQNNQWFIRAIVSSSLVKSDNSCDRDNYAIFTDISKYKIWFYKLFGLILKLKCQFVESENYYTCGVKDLVVDKGLALISDVVGLHSTDRGNVDVTELRIVSQNTFSLPNLINLFFPNLLSYINHNSKLKIITRSNFFGLKKLNKLD